MCPNVPLPIPVVSRAELGLRFDSSVRSEALPLTSFVTRLHAGLAAFHYSLRASRTLTPHPYGAPGLKYSDEGAAILENIPR